MTAVATQSVPKNYVFIPVLTERVNPADVLKSLNLEPPATKTVKNQWNQELHQLLSCKVQVAPHVAVKAYAWGHYIFVASAEMNAGIWGFQEEPGEPFITAEIVSQGYHKSVETDVPDPSMQNRWVYSHSRMVKAVVQDVYNHQYDYHTRTTKGGIPWNYLKLRVTAINDGTSEVIEAKFHRPEGGTLDLDALGPNGNVFKATYDFYGLPLSWQESLVHDESSPHSNQTSAWYRANRLLNKFNVKQGKTALWNKLFKLTGDHSKLVKGLKATEQQKDIRPNLERIRSEEPLLAAFYGWLHDESGRGGVSNNSLIAAFLKAKGTDYAVLKATLTEAMETALTTQPASYSYNTSTPNTREICLKLPGAKDKDEERRAKKEWYLRKSAREQAIGLGVSPTAHPKLLKAIEEKRIPLSLFHKAGDQLQLVNVEFDLWEKAFSRHGWEAPLCEIAQDAGRRSTYDKNVTPYIAFLFRIEPYLNRHTEKGKKWTSMPKFVASEYELEMNDAEEGGTTKRRSALTPVPDNDTRVLTVPYCAMAISGVRTTYCYSLDYQVFEENTVDRESGTPVVNELERKLNGRDDYGLMYYTLTGTPRNTGYPAFLIIFERRKAGTHVHFHRVHPCRSKDGKQTPACRLVEECYRYMAGNIRAEEIYAQQGDLIFLKTEQTVSITEEAKPVKEFESHAFKTMENKPILLIPNEAKSIKNRLGFIYSEGIFMVDHPEHEPIRGIPAGMYEVRRCKSYENNPSGVWVLNID